MVGFDEHLDMEKYLEQLEVLFSKKWNLLKNKSDYNTRQKMYRYLESLTSQS